MSRFSGRQTDSHGFERNRLGERLSDQPRGSSRKVRGNKSVMRKHRDRLYADALKRQARNLDRGFYMTHAGERKTPAPLDSFKRKEDQDEDQ